MFTRYDWLAKRLFKSGLQFNDRSRRSDGSLFIGLQYLVSCIAAQAICLLVPFRFRHPLVLLAIAMTQFQPFLT